MEPGFLLKQTPPNLTTSEINDILAKCHELAGKTGSEVLIIITLEERLYSYASPKFKPLINDKHGKTLLIKCLWDKISYKVEERIKNRDPNAPKEDAEKSVEVEERSFESVVYIENDDERHEFLKQKFLELRDIFLKKTKPGNPKGEEGLFIVGTESKIRIISSKMTKSCSFTINRTTKV